MNTAIAAFPSKALYSSLLQSAPSVAARTLAELPGVDGSDDAGDCLSPTVVFIDTAGCEFYERTDEGGVAGEGSKRNENEAELVRKYVERLVSRLRCCRALPPRSSRVRLLTLPFSLVRSPARSPSTCRPRTSPSSPRTRRRSRTSPHCSSRTIPSCSLARSTRCRARSARLSSSRSSGPTPRSVSARSSRRRPSRDCG